MIKRELNSHKKVIVSIIINDKVTARIQEMHIMIGHIMCGAIDEVFLD